MDKQTKMFALVQLLEKSGLSRESFAKQHGVSFKSLTYWCRKFKKSLEASGPVTISSGSKTSVSPSFIELVSNSQASSVDRPVQIELELVSGIRIKIY